METKALQALRSVYCAYDDSNRLLEMHAKVKKERIAKVEKAIDKIRHYLDENEILDLMKVLHTYWQDNPIQVDTQLRLLPHGGQKDLKMIVDRLTIVLGSEKSKRIIPFLIQNLVMLTPERMFKGNNRMMTKWLEHVKSYNERSLYLEGFRIGFRC